MRDRDCNCWYLLRKLDVKSVKREWENTHVDELSENGVSRELFFFVRGFSLSECIFVKVEFGKVYW